MPRRATELEIEGRTLTLSNLDKVMFPKTGFNKAQVIDYYIRCSRFILPHLKCRPLTLKRYPDGIAGEYFYEKHAPAHTPDWVARFSVPRLHEPAPIQYVLVNDLPTLVWSTNLANLELHTLLARAPDIERPTMVVFDLDPGESADILQAAEVACRVKELLDHLQLESFVKVSGSQGIHLHVPLNTPVTYDATRAFAKAMAELLAQQHPDTVVSEMPRRLRQGKVFIDWGQNDSHKSTVCVYSLRARREQPFIAAPITWAELRRALRRGDAGALSFEPAAALDRAERQGDVFEPLLRRRQRFPRQLEAAMTALASARPRRSPPGGKGLAEYDDRRDFARTTEPSPGRAANRPGEGAGRFVVQKHDASHLHYDFRLEMEGVLRSWAVPKGVPLVVGERRLAMRTEDHPLDYADFEGIIPPGNYGAGTVMVWDRGTYAVRDGHPVRSFHLGKLALTLKGSKLKGTWALVRSGSADERGERERWFMMKTAEDMRPLGARRADRSVLTGRTLEQIAADPGAVWESGSSRSAVQPSRSRRTKQRQPARPLPPGKGGKSQWFLPHRR